MACYSTVLSLVTNIWTMTLNSTIGAEHWESRDIQAFWGEIAPHDHLVQLYESENIFLNTLEGFAGDGFLKGDTVAIISTPQHLALLEMRLLSHGFHLDQLKEEGKYITADADEAAAMFMVNDWPDEKLFNQYTSKLFAQAKANGTRLRIFGEIVNQLWDQGKHGATVELEKLWHRLHHQKDFCLYCAYPKNVLTPQAKESIKEICNNHSKIIDGFSRPSTEIHYRPSRA